MTSPGLLTPSCPLCKRWTIDERLQENFEVWAKTIEKTHADGRFVPNDALCWTPFRKPLSECRVALVTTGGVHRKDQSPFDLLEPHGDWSYREIPDDTLSTELVASHSHYDTRDANKDINVMFPIDRLHELQQEGFIGSTAPVHFGFMGFIPNPQPLLETTAKEVARKLVEQGTDAVLMTCG